jgi:uncharacterized protein YciI
MSRPIATAKDIIDFKARGFLAKQLYVIFATPTNGVDPVLENLHEHLYYQQLLERRGVMFATGPHWCDDEQRWDGDSMVVVRAGSVGEAETIAREDPMHVSDARRYRVRPWLVRVRPWPVNEGTRSVRLHLSSGRFELT